MKEIHQVEGGHSWQEDDVNKAQRLGSVKHREDGMGMKVHVCLGETERQRHRERLHLCSLNFLWSLISPLSPCLRALGPAVTSMGLSLLPCGLRASALEPHKGFPVPSAAPASTLFFLSLP